MRRNSFLAILVRYVLPWLAGSAVALAGATNSQTPDAKYLELGRQFPWVVRLHTVCEAPDTAKVYQREGSAVIIGPHWLLTAAHATENVKSAVVYVDGVEYAIASLIRHTAYSAERVGFHDIALGYSAQEFKFPAYPALYAADDELHKTAVIVGYGLHGDLKTGATQFDSQRRAGQNQVARLENAVLICDSDRATQLPMEFLLASGDSGGGLFIDGKLAGINSFVGAQDKIPDGNYGDESGHTRISLYVEWIEKCQAQYLAEVAAAPK
ncbi:hypothetical protein EBZ39_01320 [bacterium]|nr:hypothetical protein [bacterium]